MNSTLETPPRLPAFALALMMTLAMLGGIDQLALDDASAMAQAQAQAQAQASAPPA